MDTYSICNREHAHVHGQDETVQMDDGGGGGGGGGGGVLHIQ